MSWPWMNATHGIGDANDYHAVFTGVLRDRASGLSRWEKHLHIGDTRDGGFADWVEAVHGVRVKRWKGEDDEELPRGRRAEPSSQQKTITASHDSSTGAFTTISDITDNTITGGSKSASDANTVAVPESEPDTLPAHCHCNGVRFRITRPSAVSKNLTSPLPDVLAKTDPAKYDPASWWLASPTQYLAGTCSCESCRLTSGTEVVEWAFVPAANIQIQCPRNLRMGKVKWVEFKPGKGIGTLKSYQSSEGVTRWFCGKCGCGVFWTGVARPELIDVAVGLFDAEEGARAESWLKWVTERVSFEEEAGDVDLVDELGKGLRGHEQG